MLKARLRPASRQYLASVCRKYKFNEAEGLCFISFATVGSVDVFTRREYKYIVVASLRFCQENKGLRLFEWVLMSNHVHLVAAAQQGSSLSDIVRDLKKFTSGRLHRAIEENGGESRREWLMPLLREAAIAQQQQRRLPAMAAGQPALAFGRSCRHRARGAVHSTEPGAGGPCGGGT